MVLFTTLPLPPLLLSSSSSPSLPVLLAVDSPLDLLMRTLLLLLMLLWLQ